MDNEISGYKQKNAILTLPTLPSSKAILNIKNRYKNEPFVLCIIPKQYSPINHFQSNFMNSSQQYSKQILFARFSPGVFC